MSSKTIENINISSLSTLHQPLMRDYNLGENDTDYLNLIEDSEEMKSV